MDSQNGALTIIKMTAFLTTTTSGSPEDKNVSLGRLTWLYDLSITESDWQWFIPSKLFYGVALAY